MATFAGWAGASDLSYHITSFDLDWLSDAYLCTYLCKSFRTASIFAPWGYLFNGVSFSIINETNGINDPCKETLAQKNGKRYNISEAV